MDTQSFVGELAHITVVPCQNLNDRRVKYSSKLRYVEKSQKFWNEQLKANNRGKTSFLAKVITTLHLPDRGLIFNSLALFLCRV